jgi:drug/metabolite transporter (DMT)-like permease
VTARQWWLFAAVSVLWGVPYFFIRVAVDAGLSPGFVAFSRVVLGFAVLLPIALRAGALRGLAARWRWILAYTFFEIAIPFPLIAWGEQRISSSLTAILIASLPLVVALVAIRMDPAERARGQRLVGLLVGFAGVVALLGFDVAGEPRELAGAVAVLVATVGYAAGPMIIKHRLRELPPLGPVCASLGVASLLLAPLAALGAPDEVPGTDAIVAIVVLGIACTSLAFLAFFALIAAIGPGRASVITYVNPVIAVALGVALLGERPGPAALAGLLLVLAGSWLSTGGRLPPGRGLRRSGARPPRAAGTAAPAAVPVSPARRS